MGKQGDRWYGVVRFNSIFGVLLGTVIIPTFALTAVGILTIVLWREDFDVAFGILILSFSAASIVGGILATVLVRRSARRAGEQSDFISGVSHELKTPLTSIQMFAETLLLGNVDDEAERRECLEHIVTESQRLATLVERLLDVRRLAEGRKVFADEPVDVAELVDAAVRSQVPLLKERGVALQAKVDQDLPTLCGDREALISAVANLVQNAVRHGGGGKRIDVRVCRDAKRVVFEVEDFGPGIPRRAMRRIFERFYRVEPVMQRGESGLGIGLALVRTIVEAHGGTVGVRSQVGKGSTFVIRLPIPVQKAGSVACGGEEKNDG